MIVAYIYYYFISYLQNISFSHAQSLGFSDVTTAKTGVEAIEQFRKHLPELILMDLMVNK